MKGLFRDLLILFGLAALWASTSRPAMQYVFDHRDGDKWWCTYPCLHGDLVSLSYLDFVKRFNPGTPKEKLNIATCPGTKNTLLVIHGDSNTWHVGDSNFACVSKLWYINRTNGGYYRLDSTKRNILVIEVAERYLRTYFGGLQIFNELRDSPDLKLSMRPLPQPEITQATAMPSIGIDDFFNKYINQNLQCNLFNYNFIMPMFESKAALNYYLFNRASGDVVISNDRNFLFLKETVTRYNRGSSYTPINAPVVSILVSNLNDIYDHYRALGFAEVYFSIIPNPATILQPGGYNNLIPLVQNDPHLKMKMIDIYSVFKKSPELLYLPGDTHWNTLGKQTWINLVNKTLAGN